ncbi:MULTISPECIES: hypothetical protein [unclassified Methylophaga]|jgi:hypothetical protein|uniref:hypothetical protein n=1 Tax=unclassified Methylophaga TaxID=2629249 RepID=UPI000C95154B|nr:MULTISPECIES: hypothetical protein [unclassified Methylophaga]MAK66309.1 hypothetical protein [Methylophaga sp.]MAY17504.1 hypothetical protein [Methylophaga sp.]MBN47446.1 hypothetical protein [Methylophaga sp.]HAO25379.1 hypothetical protein [Methylophaga sp.]HCD04212.1 hypothetical protein [Methylophaga sp.]|tara:strand:- start:3540 stop:3899 length:360 start_codon:yes stop_codon:yes gene_type:complete
MKKSSLTVLFASITMLSATAMADDKMDFSTVTKVQYVNDCMQANTKLNIYEGVHKCSCVVDKLDEAFTQTDFEDISTAYMYRNMPADKGAQFRDHKELKGGIKQYEEVSSSAYKECRIQ